MRARFTFVFLLLLVLMTVGAFLSYMEGFLTFDRGALRTLAWIVHPWSRSGPAETPREAVTVDSEPTREGDDAGLADHLRSLAQRRGLRLEVEPGVELSKAPLEVASLTTVSAEVLSGILAEAGLGVLLSQTAMHVAPMRLRRNVSVQGERNVVETDITLTATLSLGEEAWARLTDGSSVYRLGLLPRDARKKGDATVSTTTILRVSLKDGADLVSAPILWMEDGRETQIAAVPAQPLEIHAVARRVGHSSVHVALNVRRVR